MGLKFSQTGKIMRVTFRAAVAFLSIVAFIFATDTARAWRPVTPENRDASGFQLAANQAESSYRAGKWIEIRLASQRLIAWENGRVAMSTYVSTGTQRTPTVRGQFRVQTKHRVVNMRGADYYLPNVPYVMFFFRDYAIHGTYWHANFGTPMSHGCVNMPTAKAAWLYRWAPQGTLVVVR